MRRSPLPLRLLPATILAALLAGCQSTPATSTQAARASAPRHPQTILIVHGAWGGGWAFREVQDLLQRDGYKVERPTLTGQGERVHLSSPAIDLSTHIQDIVNVIEYDDLHDIVLVGHSYGGMVITGVADRVPERIKKLIYVDALLPNDGESVNDIFQDTLGRPSTDGYIHPTWKVSPQPPHDVPMPAKTFSEHLALKNPAREKIPAAYILTVDPGKQPEQDKFYPLYVRAQQRRWPVTIMEGDHNVQWSRPKELVRLLELNAQ